MESVGGAVYPVQAESCNVEEGGWRQAKGAADRLLKLERLLDGSWIVVQPVVAEACCFATQVFNLRHPP